MPFKITVSLLSAFLIIGLTTCYFHKDKSEEKYVRLINSFTNLNSEAITQTGPDKANVRDFFMTVDIRNGYVPKERLLIATKELKDARFSGERDFKWKNISTEIAGRSRAFLFNPSDGTLLGGAVTGGLWKNMDFKSNSAWQNISDFPHPSISCIVRDPQNAEVIYIGTGESFTAFTNYRESSSVGSGIWKSSDGGISWDQLSSTSGFMYINDIVIRIENGQSVIYAGVASGTYKAGTFYSSPGDGLFKSTDGGNSWSQVLPDITGETEAYAVADIELSTDNILYVGTMRNLENKGGGVILKSTDGVNWTKYEGYEKETQNISSSGSIEAYSGRVILQTAPSNSLVVYAIFMRGAFNSLNQLRDLAGHVELRISRDGGQTYNTIPTPHRWATIPWHAAALAVDPNDENRVIIGGLHLYYLPNSNNDSITDLDWIRVSGSHTFAWSNPNNSPEKLDSLSRRYVHVDIHKIEYINNSSDEILVSNDGGIFYSNNLTNATIYNPETGSNEYPDFYQINNNFTTTQFYTVALHPWNNTALTGTQDNGTSLNEDGKNTLLSNLVSGGDGAFAHWDDDNPELYLTSAQANALVINLDGNAQSFFNAYGTGTFINPTDYDHRSNLLYANAGNSPAGGLLDMQNRYMDTLLVFNMNKYLNTNDLGRDTLSYVKLNAGATEAFSAVKLSPHSPGDNATIFLGTHYGKIYRTKGLPENSVSERIDNDFLPVGYISSIDVGADENVVLVTISNYGTESVWITYDGGDSWKNIERNLPDIPVRWGVFNPFDDKKIMIATELGVWGLENVDDETMDWVRYNQNFPDVRVDMIKVRKEDSIIVAATHGRGLFFGKFNQGEKIENVTKGKEDLTSKIIVYPNPTADFLIIHSPKNENHFSLIQIHDLNGKIILEEGYKNKPMNLKNIDQGVYILRLLNDNGELIYNHKFLVQR